MANLAKNVYNASANLTCTLASLASSASWLAGREATFLDNTSNLYLDYKFTGKITVGTTPTINTEIRIYLMEMLDDSTWPDVMDGTDSDETWTSAGVRDSAAKLAKIINVDAATSDRAYLFDAGYISSFFGGVCPPKVGVFISHNTGVNLNSTGGNHQLTMAGVHQNLNA